MSKLAEAYLGFFLLTILCGIALASPTTDLLVRPVYVGDNDIFSGRGWGYIDMEGNYVISPQFDIAYQFSEGYAWVVIDSLYYLIDKAGSTVIDQSYTMAREFNHGLAPVEVDGKWGYIDASGNYVIGPQYDSAESFSEGYARVEVGNGCGYIDTQGNLITETIYDYWAQPFCEGLAGVGFPTDDFEMPRNMGYIDTTGTIVIYPEYNSVSPFYNGIAGVSTGPWHDRKCGFINSQGEVIIPLIYEDAGWTFSEGTAPVCTHGRWGFIDIEGNFVIQPHYEDAWNFSDGNASVCIDGKWGVIDSEGNLVVAPLYDYALHFSHGLAAAKKDGKIGFIDINGDTVIPFRYDYVEMNDWN